MKRLLMKLKNHKGFSLAEMLLAILIMLFVSAIMATGIPAAKNAYERVVVGANARSMLFTAITALHDEIGTAWNIEPTLPNATSITYFNASTGARSTISLDADDHNAIQVQDYVAMAQTDMIHDYDVSPIEGTEWHLVPDTSTELFVKYSNVSYEPTTGIVTIKGLQVCKRSNSGGDDPVIASMPDNTDLTIRVISKNMV